MWYFRRVNRGSLSKDRYLFKQRTEETEGMMNAVFGKREKVQGSWCEDELSERIYIGYRQRGW